MKCNKCLGVGRYLKDEGEDCISVVCDGCDGTGDMHKHTFTATEPKKLNVQLAQLREQTNLIIAQMVDNECESKTIISLLTARDEIEKAFLYVTDKSYKGV
jgi:hypothetical protein